MIAESGCQQKFSFLGLTGAFHFLQLAVPAIGPTWKALIRSRKSLISR